MPKIIRSSGVNIDRASSILVPLRDQKEAAIQAASAPASDTREIDMAKIMSSANLIVEEIISKARNDADNMLVDARQETMNVLQDAVREGWEQGMQDALKQMKALQQAAALEVDEAIESIVNERRSMIKNMERDVLELVFDIVDKVLSIEMNRSEEWIASMVKTALLQMEGDDTVVMKVAASAREKVAEVSENLVAAAGKNPARFSVAVGARLPPGGCIIETCKGTINNTVEDKTDKLKTLLRENT